MPSSTCGLPLCGVCNGHGWTLTPKSGGGVKSQVQVDQLELAEYILADAHAMCSVIGSLELKRDVDYVRKRFKDEGVSFLTITLPQFARDFERSLASGEISSKSFQGFGKDRRIPAFLRGIVSRVFDRSTGRLSVLVENLEVPHVSVPTLVLAVRQVCLAFKKLELECTPGRVRRALLSFEQTEQELSTFEVQESDKSRFHTVARQLWDPIVSGLRVADMVPRHGPGTTSEGISGNQKYHWRFWHERVERFFPFLDNAYTIGAVGSEELSLVEFLPPERELPCKVVPVPKTLKAPRIIAIEPCCNQYAQQAIREALYSALQMGRFTSGHVNFDDQSVNQRLAVKSSVDGTMATLDLSDASDRVLNALAASMFESNPDLWDAIQACRSTHARLPDGHVVGPLVKFASMGNALTFPVESMYFYTICVETLLRELSLPVTVSNLREVCEMVYVYGDDLVVPTRYAEAIVIGLQRYACKVNAAKSFWTGKFRESCGADAYEGALVTPVYIRSVLPTSRKDATSVVSLCAAANQLAYAGWQRSANFLFERIERLCGKLPTVEEDSPVVGRIAWFGERLSSDSLSGKYQRAEVKGWVPAPVHRTDELEGYAALTKSLSSMRADPFGMSRKDPRHLERSSRFGAVTLKRQRVPVYQIG